MGNFPGDARFKYVRESDSEFTLTCDWLPYEQSSKYVLQWRKQGELILECSYHECSESKYNVMPAYQSRVTLLDGKHLQVRRIDSSDNGLYDCVVKKIAIQPDASQESTFASYTLILLKPPFINRHSSRRSIHNVGDSVSLFCEAVGEPRPEQFYWFHNDILMRESGHDSMQQRDSVQGIRSELRFTSLSHSDSGSYSCFTNNSIGHTSVNFTLIVRGYPFIVKPPVNVTVDTGKKFDLSCGAMGEPSNISIIWLKNGVKMRENVVDSFLPSSRVEIQRAQWNDTGWYFCIATNGLWNSTEALQSTSHGYHSRIAGLLRKQLFLSKSHIYAAAYVSVRYSPRFLHQTTTFFFGKGKPGKLVCILSAFPKVLSVEWVRIHPTPATFSSVDAEPPAPVFDSNGLPFQTFVYPIGSMDISYGGIYRCRGANSVTTSTFSANITIRIADAPYFEIQPPKRLTILRNSSHTLSCSAKGVPMPRIFWYKLSLVPPPRGFISKREFDELQGETHDVVRRYLRHITSTHWLKTRRSDSNVIRDEDDDINEDDLMMDDATQSELIRNNDKCHELLEKLKTLLGSDEEISYLSGPMSHTRKNGSSFQLSNVQVHDMGVYYCVAHSIVDTLVASSIIWVVAAPPQQPRQLRVTCHLLSVDANWSPGYDGGEPQQFTLHYRLPINDIWDEVLVPSQGATHHVLTGLLPDEKYVFALSARNKYGRSEWSTTESCHTLSYSLDRVQSLPKDAAGHIYFPSVLKPMGPKPSPPKNVTAVTIRDSNGLPISLMLLWSPPKPFKSRVLRKVSSRQQASIESVSDMPPILYYRVEYTLYDGDQLFLSNVSDSKSSSRDDRPHHIWYSLPPIVAPLCNLTLTRLPHLSPGQKWRFAPNDELIVDTKENVIFTVRAFTLLNSSNRSEIVVVSRRIFGFLQARYHGDSVEPSQAHILWWGTIAWICCGALLVFILVGLLFYLLRCKLFPRKGVHKPLSMISTRVGIKSSLSNGRPRKDLLNRTDESSIPLCCFNSNKTHIGDGLEQVDNNNILLNSQALLRPHHCHVDEDNYRVDVDTIHSNGITVSCLSPHSHSHPHCSMDQFYCCDKVSNELVLSSCEYCTDECHGDESHCTWNIEMSRDNADEKCHHHHHHLHTNCTNTAMTTSTLALTNSNDYSLNMKNKNIPFWKEDNTYVPCATCQNMEFEEFISQSGKCSSICPSHSASFQRSEGLPNKSDARKCQISHVPSIQTVSASTFTSGAGPSHGENSSHPLSSLQTFRSGSGMLNSPSNICHHAPHQRHSSPKSLMRKNNSPFYQRISQPGDSLEEEENPNISSQPLPLPVSIHHPIIIDSNVQRHASNSMHSTVNEPCSTFLPSPECMQPPNSSSSISTPIPFVCNDKLSHDGGMCLRQRLSFSPELCQAGDISTQNIDGSGSEDDCKILEKTHS